jgi:hypothetical protein
MIVVLAVYVSLMVGVVAPMLQTMQSLSMGAVAAWQIRIIREAVALYMKDSFATVYASATSPINIPISGANSLQSLGYLGNNFGTGNNPLNQSHQIVMARAGANQLAGSVLTVGGRAFSAQTVDIIANWIGEYAGYVPYAGEPAGGCSPTPCLKGVSGIWSMPMSTFVSSLGTSVVSGHLAAGLFFNQGQVSAPFVYRFDLGDPDQRTLHADLYGNGYSLTGALKVTASQEVDSPTFADYTSPSSWYLKPAGASNVNTMTATTYTATTSVTSPVYYHTSDLRKKDVTGRISDACEQMSKIEGIYFNWKKDGSPDMGFGAQQVQQVFPEAVGVDEKGDLAIKYDVLLAPTIECMRDKGLLDPLKDRLEDPKTKERFENMMAAQR